MKNILLTTSIIFLFSCASMSSDDPDSMSFSIPVGSTLSLHKDLFISDGNTHAVIQAGKLTTEGGRNNYEISCRFDVKEFGPRTIKPENFIVSRTEDGWDWVSQPAIKRFYTQIFLQSNKGTDVIKLECQEWGDAIDRNFTVAEMEPSFGDYFSLTFLEKNK